MHILYVAKTIKAITYEVSDYKMFPNASFPVKTQNIPSFVQKHQFFSEERTSCYVLLMRLRFAYF